MNTKTKPLISQNKTKCAENRNTEPLLTVVCCSVFKAEILALKKQHWPNLSIRFMTSMLHMKPDLLAARVEAAVKETLSEQRKVLLIYGDCSIKMGDLTQHADVVRLPGNNCCDQILGRKKYRQLSHEGAFFIFPEWAKIWKHIFSKELGLNPNNAASLMGDMHRKLIYLDTGLLPVPVKELERCSKYCGLPWEVLPVSLEPLRIQIERTLDTLTHTVLRT